MKFSVDEIIRLVFDLEPEPDAYHELSRLEQDMLDKKIDEFIEYYKNDDMLKEWFYNDNTDYESEPLDFMDGATNAYLYDAIMSWFSEYIG